MCFPPQCCTRSLGRFVSVCWRSGASSPSKSLNTVEEENRIIKKQFHFCKLCCVFLRYGVEPPVLVKLEKEIELEETLLMAEEPPPAVKTFSVCCQHGGLYQPGVSPD